MGDGGLQDKPSSWGCNPESVLPRPEISLLRRRFENMHCHANSDHYGLVALRRSEEHSDFYQLTQCDEKFTRGEPE